MNNTKLNKNNKEKWITFTDAVEYSKAIEMMKSKVEKIKNGLLSEQILLLEHPSLYTAGTSSKDSDLIVKNDIPIYKTGRGGQWTWHGPGQRIVWPLLDLNHRKKVKEYLVETGQMKPEDIEPNSFEVMAQQFQDNKDAFDSKLSKITNPKNAIKRKMIM